MDKCVQNFLLNLSTDYSRVLHFFINNKEVRVDNVDPKVTLLDYLRENGYTGTKHGCGEGGCGACTVVIAEYDLKKEKVRYRTANSCLFLLCSAHLKQIITIEGIGDNNNPHPTQERIAKGHGSQCGFCTPGFVMSLFGLLKLNPEPLACDIEEAFDGNLCRCTGYRPILEAARSFSKGACVNSNESLANRLVDFTQFKPYCPNEDIPFPSELLDKQIEPFFTFKNEILWFQPVALSDLLRIKENYPNAKLISGNTEVGVEMKIKRLDYSVFVNVLHVDGLKDFNVKYNETLQTKVLEIGANNTLTELIDAFENAKSLSIGGVYFKSLVNAFLHMLRWFASRQIRNFASLGGNITTASPISDLNPILLASNARLTIPSSSTALNLLHRDVSIRDFFIGYRKINMEPNEILLSISIPLSESNTEIIRSYKQAKRKEDDISIVNAAFKVKLDKREDGYFILSLDLVYGGLAPTTICLDSVSKTCAGLKWGCDGHLKVIEDAILNEINLPYTVPGGMPTYRRTLAVSFFTRFWYQVMRDLSIAKSSPLTRNIDEIERDISKSKQEFSVSNKDPYIGTVQSHATSLSQATGIAKYTDDIPRQYDELIAYPVQSTKAHAYIKRVDATNALTLDGVREFVSAKDVPCHNVFGIFKDEELFATKEILFYGQIIGLILADTYAIAKKAAHLVLVEYEPLDAVVTIEDAIESNSFYSQIDMVIEKGSFDTETFEAGETGDLIFENVCRIGGQEHFYLEPHGCVVVPKNEDNEFIVYSSTQNPNEIQADVAKVLGLPFNRVVCRVKRLGGGFGGKESRATPVAMMAAVAAYKTKRSVRFILDRQIDMLITGGRHPYWAKYKLRVTRNGLFKACDFDLISNAGHSIDLSVAVMEKALTSCDNAYLIPNFRVRGRLAKTNIASNTAFRGFGSPQAMLAMEMMVSEVADQLGIGQMEIRQLNMYKENDTTHFNTTLTDWFVPDMWNSMLDEYARLRDQVVCFNRENVWKKRGISIVPAKCGIGFGLSFLNQGSASVHIYTDGSVLLSHGGIEMGQGLHTKMIQIAANTLQVPCERIFISETATDKTINNSSTAASYSSDINGMAIYNACTTLKARLEPYRLKNPTGDFSEWVNEAYLNRVCLSAYGFFETGELDYNMKTNTGLRYAYFTTGVAVAVVELDVLTGDHTTLRADIQMDIGQSINYAVDIGQIEGAFVQGAGWCTLEEVLLESPSQSLITRGPGNYKIPSSHDIPVEFNVKILEGKVYKDLKAIKSSKGIGEPPLLLGVSVYFALRDAVVNARQANGVNEPLLDFPSPCTSEVLRLSCRDSTTQKATVLPNGQSSRKEKLWSQRP